MIFNIKNLSKLILSSSNCNGIQWFHLYATDAATFNDLNFHITWFTPLSAPGVSHNPVLNTRFITPTNYVCSMVKISSTKWWIKYSRGVKLENTLVGFKCHRKRLNCQSSFHLSNVVTYNIYVAISLNTCRSGRIVFTCFSDSLIWVSFFRLSFCSHIIVESLVLPSSIATVVCSWTVHKLLFWNWE